MREIFIILVTVMFVFIEYFSQGSFMKDILDDMKHISLLYSFLLPLRVFIRDIIRDVDYFHYADADCSFPLFFLHDYDVTPSATYGSDIFRRRMMTRFSRYV